VSELILGVLQIHKPNISVFNHQNGFLQILFYTAVIFRIISVAIQQDQTLVSNANLFFELQNRQCLGGLVEDTKSSLPINKSFN
jgi:hypothetical protein